MSEMGQAAVEETFRVTPGPTTPHGRSGRSAGGESA